MTCKPEALATNILQAVRSREGVCVLYADPKVTPTPPKVLDGIEKEIGAALPPEVRGFYSGAERLFLVW
jgi:hypothetical protein